MLYRLICTNTCKCPTSLASMPTSVQCSQGFSFQVKSLWNASTHPEANTKEQDCGAVDYFQDNSFNMFKTYNLVPETFLKADESWYIKCYKHEWRSYWEIIPPSIQSFNKFQHSGQGRLRPFQFPCRESTFEEATLPPRIRMVLLHQCVMISEYLFMIILSNSTP